jgi:hypothetical protein
VRSLGFSTSEFALSLFVGIIATPLAPIAKDLSTSLQAGVSSIGPLKSAMRR